MRRLNETGGTQICDSVAHLLRRVRSNRHRISVEILPLIIDVLRQLPNQKNGGEINPNVSCVWLPGAVRYILRPSVCCD